MTKPAKTVSVTGTRLAVSTTAANTLLPFDSNGLFPREILFTATVSTCVKLTNGGTATTADLMVQPGDAVVLTVSGFTGVSAITVSGTGVLTMSPLENGPWKYDTKTLDLDFTASQAFDPRITFTRASNGTRFNSAGTLVTMTNDQPRIDYDPVTLACKGLLIEEQRTNLLLNSDALATQSVTVTAVAHTLSFYGTGVVTLSGAASGTLTGTGDFPTRSSLTFTPTAGTLTLTVTGSCSKAQLEAGAFPTSYIPTVAAQVTRAADVASMTGANFSSWYNQTQGTLYSEIIFASASGSDKYAIDVNDGTTNNRISVWQWTGNNQEFATILTGGVNVAQTSNGVSIVGGVAYKSAIAFTLNDYASSFSGGTVGTDTSLTLPTVNKMSIGARGDGSLPMSGHIRRIAYYPTRLPNATLQALTA